MKKPSKKQAQADPCQNCPFFNKCLLTKTTPKFRAIYCKRLGGTTKSIAEQFQLKKTVSGKFQWLTPEDMKKRFLNTDVGGMVWNARYSPNTELPAVAINGYPDQGLSSLVSIQVKKQLSRFCKN